MGGNEGHEGSGAEGDEEESSHEGHEGDEEEGRHEGHEGDEEEGSHEGHEGDEEESSHEGHEGDEEEGGHEGHEGEQEEVCLCQEVPMDPGNLKGAQGLEDHWLLRHQEGHTAVCQGKGALQPVSAAPPHVRMELQVWGF